MKYKVGDKVLIVNKRSETMNGEGEMDKYLGTIMTIRNVNIIRYKMVEDCHEFRDGWSWFDHDIQGKIVGNRLIKE